MKTFRVYYVVDAYDCIDIDAESEEEAREMFERTSSYDLIDGKRITGVEPLIEGNEP